MVVDALLAQSWLAQACELPGWGTGPEFAPHPIRALELAPDDPDA